MTKRIILLLIMITAASLFWAAPAMAYTPPSQSTDNATDIILWHGDNLTGSMDLTGNISISIADFEEAITNALIAGATAGADEAAEKQQDLYDEIWPLVLMMILTFLAYYLRERVLCVLAGFVMILYALPIEHEWRTWGIIFLVWGIYNFVKAWRDKEYWKRL